MSMTDREDDLDSRIRSALDEAEQQPITGEELAAALNNLDRERQKPETN